MSQGGLSFASSLTVRDARPDSPELSIIIPIHNGASTLRACLDALLRAPGPTREIVVVDDASRDNSADIAAQLGVRTAKLNVNCGCAAARNEGEKQTSSPILVFIDCDVVIYPDALERISNFFLANPEQSAVFGSYDSRPTASNFVSQYRNLLHHFTHQRGKPGAETFWTGLGAVRRSAFQCVGGFRSGRFGMEDVDFGLRVSDAGFPITLDSQLLGTHLKRWTLLGMVRSDVFDRAMPWADVVLNRGRFTNDLNTSRNNKLGVIFAGIAIISLIVSVRWPVFGAIAVISLLLTMANSIQILTDFRRERGLIFTVGVIPLHFLHQLCAGLGFTLALLKYTFYKVRRSIRNLLRSRIRADLVEQTTRSRKSWP